MKEFDVAQLEKQTIKKIITIAGELGVPDEEIKNLNKQNLIFKVLEAQAKKKGLLFSEGVLECLGIFYLLV